MTLGRKVTTDALLSSHWGHSPFLSEHLWADSYPSASTLMKQHFLHPPSVLCKPAFLCASRFALPAS